MSIYIHSVDLWVGASEKSMGNVIRSTTKRAESRSRKVIESCSMLAVVECACSLFHYIFLFFEGDSFHMPESIANPGVDFGLVMVYFL